MDTISAFGFEACCAAIAGDIARALAARNGEPAERQFARAQAAVHMIMGFLPRDVVEAMLAGHCVMFHELMVGSVRDALSGQDAKARRAEVHELLAMNKAFCGNLIHLRHYQRRPAEGRREAPLSQEPRPQSVSADVAGKQTVDRPADGSRESPHGQNPGPPPVSADVAREQAVPEGVAQASTPVARNQTAAAQSSPKAPAGSEAALSTPGNFSAIDHPTAEAVAACGANSAAATALNAEDAAGFARAMGIEQPSAAFLAAANTAGSPFDPEASGPWPDSALQDKRKP